MEEKTEGKPMKKLTVILLILLALLAGCAKESEYQPTGAASVTMTVSDVTPTGAVVTIQDCNPEPFVYGEWYVIEQQKDGLWYEVKTKLNDYGFNEIGWLTDENGALTMDVDWEWLYGELPAGQYRILKQAGTQLIDAEFAVE